MKTNSQSLFFSSRLQQSILLLCLILLTASIGIAGQRGLRVKMDELDHKSGKVGRYHALIIGINEYQDEKIPDLATAVNDATKFATLLETEYGFTTSLLLNEKASRANIYRQLRKLAAEARPEDSLLIYYAGHGDIDRQYNDGWWIPADAIGGDPVTYFDNVQIQKAMKNMAARHVLLISDSCYSGTLFGSSRSLPPVINDKYYLSLYNEKSRWGITSGNKTPVEDGGAEGHSIFAYQLIKELRNNSKKYISTQDIYTKIAPIIANNSEQTPLCRPIKNTGDQGGEFVFIKLNTEPPKPANASSSHASLLDISTQTKNATRPPPPPTTSLKINSNPPGAHVLINGKNSGKTPLEIDGIITGSTTILLTKEDYVPATRVAELSPNKRSTFNFDLQRKEKGSGWLTVKAIPGASQVKIMNIKEKYQPGIKLTEGDYLIKISAIGYETEERWIKIEEGDELGIDIKLTKIPAGKSITILEF